jgi:chromosomal replication initiator protein
MSDGPSVEVIIRTVASACDVTPIDVRSRRRNKHIVLARHTGMWLTRRTTPLSYPAIGRAFGRRDHSSVMHAVRRIEEAMQDDPAFALQVLELARLLGDDERALAE